MAVPRRTPQVREWRLQQLHVVQRTEKDVLALLRQTRLDITAQLAKLDKKDTFSAQLRRKQIQLIRKEVAKEQANLWRKMGDLIKARRLDAAARVIELGVDFDAYMFNTIGKSGLFTRSVMDALIEAEKASARSAIDRMIARVQGDSYVSLSQRVYTSSVNIGTVLDNKVNSALARGLSAREFAEDLKPYINPDTPGGIRYASMRLARTEINNAAHAVSVENAQGKPWLESMQWELSASHPKPDECDDIAEGGPRSDGVYEVTKVPARPHPQCFCIVTPVSVDDKTFLDQLAGGGYDDYLARYLPKAA